MQDYTPLGSTATTTVKDGILNHEKNINALRSTYSGTAFPTENLVAGMKCYRTDLGKTYTYSGKTWDDSVNTSSLTVSGETSVPTPATANNSKTIANTEFVHSVVSNLVNGAPTALDTLQELATALGNDPNFATTILNKIGEKESKTDAQIEYKKLQDAIPTKVSQLSNDSGYQKTAEIPVVSQVQNGYMSKSDKAKLDGIEEGATNVTDYVQSVTESNGKITVTKGGGDSTIINLIDTFYPIGSVYMSADKTKTKADFPVLQYGTWEEVPANLCLQTGASSEAGTQRGAGLPNITGKIYGGVWKDFANNNGAFAFIEEHRDAGLTHASGYSNYLIEFDASKSNSIYGSSDTIQPPAYMVRAWVRTA
jgi:hypothetical protein